MKLVGAIIIVLSCTVFGAIKAYAVGVRAKTLLKFESSLKQLSTLIEMNKMPLTDAFKTLAILHKSEFYDDVAQLISTDGAQKAWNNCIAKYSRSMGLSKSDLIILYQLGLCLGKLDTKNQIDRINYVIQLINENRLVAQKESKRLAPLYLNMGIITGLFICIMLVY